MKNKLSTIQYLRGFAALLVLFSHVETNFNVFTNPGLTGADRSHFDGQFGVGVFFVISGFIMYHISGRSFGSARSGVDFFVRRFLRIAPLYWLCTFGAAVLLLKSGKLSFDLTSIKHIILSVLFIPYDFAEDKFRPVHDLGWTLNYEMFFYAIFALSLTMRRKIGLAFTFFIFLGLVALGLTDPSSSALMAWTRPVILLFLFGITLGMIYERYGARLPRLSEPVALAILVVGFLVQTWLYNLRIGYHPASLEAHPLYWTLAIAMVCVGLCASAPSRPEALLPRGLLTLGDSSFSLYLTHPFAIFVMVGIWVHTGQRIPAPIMIVATCVAAIIGGYVCYRWIELPMHRYARTMLTRRAVNSPPIEAKVSSN